MSRQVTTSEAAEILGISDSAVRQRIKASTLKGRKRGNRVMVTLNGDEPTEQKKASSPEITLEEVIDDLIANAKLLKRTIKAHDQRVRQQAISEFATTLAETVQKGVK